MVKSNNKFTTRYPVNPWKLQGTDSARGCENRIHHNISIHSVPLFTDSMCSFTSTRFVRRFVVLLICFAAGRVLHRQFYVWLQFYRCRCCDVSVLCAFPLLFCDCICAFVRDSCSWAFSFNKLLQCLNGIGLSRCNNTKQAPSIIHIRQ